MCKRCASAYVVCTRSELRYLLQANPKAKVADPIPGMIAAINKYLQASLARYHMSVTVQGGGPEQTRA